MAGPRTSQTLGSPASAGLSARLRTVLIGALIGLGCLSLAAYTASHWVERQILSTDNYVATIEPLPNNSVVAGALSDYGVAQLYSAVNVPQTITNALPPQASFLAIPLSNQLHSLAVQAGVKAVMSDQFNVFWVGANRALSTTLVMIARSTPGQPLPSGSIVHGTVNLSLDLSYLRSLIAQHLGSTSTGVFNNLSNFAGGSGSIQVNLHSDVQQLRDCVKTIDYTNAVLPYLAIACLLGAIALAKQRHRTVLALSLVIIILSLLQLVGLRALRPAILNEVANSSYRPAVNVIISALVHDFNESVWITLIVSTIVYAGSLILTGPGRWATAFKAWMRWAELQKTDLGKQTKLVRIELARNKLQLWGGGAVVALAIMAFWSSVNWTTITQAVLSFAIYAAAVELVSARRAPAKPKAV